jgi:OOP family OmpA-OmpF porin
MRVFAAPLCAAICLAASCAVALDLPAGARLAVDTSRPGGSYAVPIAPFRGGDVPVVTLSGPLNRQAWQIPSSPLTTFEIVDMLRAQFVADGFHAAFDCATDGCGGFDFRFGIDVLDAPEMFVNLRDFHFATLLRGPEGAPDAAVTLLASRAQSRLYIQISAVNSGGLPAPDAQVPEPDEAAPPEAGQSEAPVPETAPVSALLSRGSVVLDGLEFDTGATSLGPGPFPSLEALAGYLKANPGLRIALVGHTDSVGGLDGNIRISRERARSVRVRLIDAYDIAPERLEAEGMGYLAPRASNLTPEGRQANRRVEAIVLSLD